MNVVDATGSYERWANSQVPLHSKDLQYKHRQMDKGVSPFLRATFYRWVQLWSEACPDLAAAPGLLAVGDLHIENFGTWRDAEGRLVWGVNDFDEASRAPAAVRSPDPSWTVHGRWVLRRLGPHESRIELADLPGKRDEREILRAMGTETANVHFGTPQAIAAVKRDLKARRSKWLFAAAVKMATATRDDWRRWKAR